MSGDSSLGIGIGLALKSYGRGLTYVKTDRALDLGNLEPFTIPDLSGNANTATLYSGIYVSTNGTTDKAIGANATALGSGNYYLTGKVKPAGTTAKTTMNGSTASNLTGLTAGVWQDFQTATASAITPGSINLGWDGTAFNATVDNWSDVKLHDASDDSVVAHYKLYDSADASLNSYPVLDCVGGYHGAHVGCAGGSGEASILQTAGEDFNKLVWFDGAGVEVDTNTQLLPATADFSLAISFVATGNPAADEYLFGSDTSVPGRYLLELTSSGTVQIFVNGIGSATTANAINANELNTVIFRRTGTTLGVSLNGGTEATMTGASAIETTTNSIIGSYLGLSPFRGLITSLTIGATAWDGSQTGAVANGWTVNGSPSLYHVAESETTAGQDALGNAIENPRPNERVLNLTTGTGYAEIADSASLDLTTAATWELWGNFYGVPASQEAIISKYNTGGNQRSWYFSKTESYAADKIEFRVSNDGATPAACTINGLTDKVSQIVLTKNGATYAAYIDGVSTTITGTPDSGSVFNSTAPVLIGSVLLNSVVGWLGTYPVGDIRIYDRALTADEVLKNYNARKSAYGL
jgi:hypothetical protein